MSSLQRKIALLSFSILFLPVASCRSQNDPATNESAPSGTVVSTTPPFQTKEPDRYRATRTITIVNAEGQTVVTKGSIARDGEMRRTESETASKTVAYLDLPEGRFVLLPADKVYADIATEADFGPAEESEISAERLLHSEATNTSYQKVGTELIGGRNANKYRIVVNSSSPGNVSVSETLIWIDEALNMPIRSETISNGTKITMELSDMALDVDRQAFQIPVDYKKIAFSELRKRLQPQKGTKNEQKRDHSLAQ